MVQQSTAFLNKHPYRLVTDFRLGPAQVNHTDSLCSSKFTSHAKFQIFSNPVRNAHIYIVFTKVLQLFLKLKSSAEHSPIMSHVPSFNPSPPKPGTCVGKAAVCMVPMAVAVPELLALAVLPGPWWQTYRSTIDGY